MPNLDDILSVAPGVVSRESDGELVVVLPKQGKFVVLNGTGSEVFQLLDGQRSLSEIAGVLGERYEVPLKQTQTDVLALAQKLLDRGAVRVSSE
jgi:hypothetical protein